MCTICATDRLSLCADKGWYGNDDNDDSNDTTSTDGIDGDDDSDDGYGDAYIDGLT